MTALSSTKYGNNTRTVTGTPTLSSSDVVLECDTTSGPVTINLLSIPAGFWNTTWKLYVFDSANNAGTNNITIIAPTNFKINDAQQVVIDYNGGGGYVRIGDNTNYIWSYNSSAAPILDTGWLDLQGFSFIIDNALRPQYRVIGSQIVFRRNVIIPLNGPQPAVAIENYTVSSGISSYESLALVAPFAGTGSSANGVIINTNGSITFNNGNSVLQSSAHNPGATYSTPFQIGLRRVYTDKGSSNETMLTCAAILSITSAGVMVINLVSDIETGVQAATNGLGSSLLRFLTSKITAGSYTPDYVNTTKTTSVAIAYSGLTGVFQVGETVIDTTSKASGVVYTDSAGTLTLVGIGQNNLFVNSHTIQGLTSGATATITTATVTPGAATIQSNPTSLPMQIAVPIPSDSAKHAVTLDAAQAAQVGGFQFNIGVLIAWRN